MEISDLAELHSILNKTTLLLAKEDEFSNQGCFGFVVEGLMLVGIRILFIKSNHVFQVIIAITGIIGNTFCIISFSIKSKKSNFHHLMLATAVFELLYISSATALFAVPHLAPR